MKPWWTTGSLYAEDGALRLDGVDLAELARRHGTPLYAYSRTTIRRQLARMSEALSGAVGRHRIYYAMKSNRNEDVLAAVRSVAGTGVDTCSPREITLALTAGFTPEDLSFNAGMLSNRDLSVVAGSRVHATLDTRSSLRRYGAMVPRGTPVGLRFDPGVAASYGQHPRMVYGLSKFGFDFEEAEDAVASARAAGLEVDSVATHIGWGLPEAHADLVDRAFARLAAVAGRIEGLRSVNVGGGLGGRYRAEDRPMLLETWAGLVAKHFGPLDVEVVCEPGTWVVGQAGVLLVEVNTVEQRRGARWIGVDAGYAINVLPAQYDIPLEIIPVAYPGAPPIGPANVAGHINEGIDVWARDRPLPDIREGDLLALWPAGAYGSSMASDHCLRGSCTEVAVG